MFRIKLAEPKVTLSARKPLNLIPNWAASFSNVLLDQSVLLTLCQLDFGCVHNWACYQQIWIFRHTYYSWVISILCTIGVQEHLRYIDQ